MPASPNERGAGCLYKKEYLYKDICRKDLFMNLPPPLADDVWFYFMGALNGTKQIVLKRNGYTYISFDNFYQYFHRHSSLASLNCHETQNDVQIKNMMKYYNLEIKNNRVIKVAE